MSTSEGAGGVRQVQVPVARWVRWCENFGAGHDGATLSTAEGLLRGVAGDGSWFEARLPLDESYDGPADAAAFAGAATPSGDWGVLLVRKGGFAVARLEGAGLVESKVGQRHVQGRTKAGGQSQQRFARRRDNQARQAYAAAAEHAARILAGARRVVTGGDRAAVEEVLRDARLARVHVVGGWHAVPDPRRAVLDGVIAEALSMEVRVLNT